MNGISAKIRWAAALLLLAGCKSTQYPSLAPSKVDRESINRSYSYHDPFADNDNGPYFDRPRGYERPRALARKAEETYQMTNQIQQSNGDPVGTNPSASRYPNSVEP